MEILRYSAINFSYRIDFSVCPSLRFRSVIKMCAVRSVISAMLNNITNKVRVFHETFIYNRTCFGTKPSSGVTPMP
jgi:hypothetical protein